MFSPWVKQLAYGIVSMAKHSSHKHKSTAEQILTKKIVHHKGGTFAALFIGGISVVLLTIALFSFLYAGKAYPGVSVVGVQVGGKDITQTQQQLEKAFSNKFPTEIKLVYQERTWTIPTASISASIDYRKTAIETVSFGRKGSIIGNTQAIINGVTKGVDLPLQIAVDSEQFRDTIATIASEIDIPREEPSLLIEDPTIPQVAVTEGREGKVLDQEKAKQEIYKTLSLLSSSPIHLLPQTLSVNSTAEQRMAAKRRAETLLNKSLQITAGETSVELQGLDLVSFVDIESRYDKNDIASYSATLATQTNHPPQDASFQFEGNKVTVFKPSKDGVTLDQEKATSIIIDTLIRLESTSSAQLEAALPLQTAPPRVTTADANNLGIKELIGIGISYYRGSGAERIHNLSLLTSKLNGTLVPPGEIFSIYKTAGDISQATGYKQAYIIQGGRTILGDGGGSCQPSTTLFRAALAAGLPIEERHPHAYRVSYYEQGGAQPGFDASIFLPGADFKFKNDTASHILIQAYTIPNESKLVFELYGTKDGREVSLSQARVWDQAPAPPPLYQDDPMLPKGTIKQVDFAAPGAKTAFDYKVTREGQVLQERTFFTTYRPWQAIFLKGTKE